MKPRILFFLDTIATGGAERQTVQLAKELMKQGYSCHLLGYYADHSQIVVDDEIRPYVRFVGGKSMRNVWEWPKAWSIISELKADVVATVNLSPLPIVVLGRALGFIKTKVVGVFHTTMFKTEKMRKTYPIVRIAMRFTDCLVYVCKAQREYWEHFGLRAPDTVVIHNGIDAAHFAAEQVTDTVEVAKARLGFATTDYVIGLTAVFRPSKNHKQAVDAVAELRKSGIPAKLLLVGGDGETRLDIVRYVKTAGLEDHVVFVIGPDDVRPLQKSMDVGLLCSTTGETFSIAALETMSMSVPMVMSRISGCMEMVEENRGGRIFDIGNTEQLVSCLRELYEPILRKRVSAEARNIVLENFTETGMVEKYHLLFEKLVMHS